MWECFYLLNGQYLNEHPHQKGDLKDEAAYFQFYSNPKISVSKVVGFSLLIQEYNPHFPNLKITEKNQLYYIYDKI